ncbi:hypothetical protein ScPMuIL_000927 [Solemya velum]
MDENKPSDTISKTLLKFRTGEFDLESIHILDLHNCGITDLGCLGECSVVEHLDLSKNDISRLHKLAGLSHLTWLNLSRNRITSVEGLQSLENLQWLNLAGNLIGSVDSLRCLAGLDKLTSIRLQDSVCGLSNPACMNNSYRKEALKMLPHLISLDGERLTGPGSEVFTICHEMDRSLKVINNCKDIELPQRPEPISDQFWQKSKEFEESNLADAEQQLEDLLASCKRLTEKTEEKLGHLENR